MSNKVIYIEADEEITSVISRIKKVREPKVALVIPKGSIVLGSIVNLKMLKKHEKDLGKEITIATTDRTGRHLASQVGFTAVHSLNVSKEEGEKGGFKVSASGPTVEFKEDREPEKPATQKDVPEITFKKIGEQEKPVSTGAAKAAAGAPKKKHLSKLAKKLILGFGALSFITLVLAFFFVLPKAVISISPKAEEVRQEIALTVKPKDGDIEGVLVEAPEELSKSYKATGKKNVGEKAKGTITVYNEWDSNAQPLVLGTRFVSSDSKVFKTTQAVNVPGTTVQAGHIVAGTATVSVEADQMGESYNIGPSNFTIPGLPSEKQAKIYGKSTQAMSGGLTKEIKVVSKKDIEDAKNNIDDEFLRKAKEDLGKKAQGKKILEAAFKEDVLEEKLSASEGQEALEFTLSIKKSFWTFAFDEGRAKEKIISKIKETLSEDKELVEGKLENVEYKLVDLAKESGMNLSVAALAFATKKLELSRTKQDLPGKNREEVIQYFKQNKEITDVKVDFWPFWVKKVPLNRSRIEIKVEVGK